MKIVIAPNAFKESATAIQVSKAIGDGFKNVFPNADIILVPMADGGEGTLATLLYGAQLGQPVTTGVTDPLGNTIQASYGILNKTAIIEMAQASGLALVPAALRNPLKTSTKGTGELIIHALNQGCRRFIMTLGGSATCDGGMGALAALGIEFYDKSNKLLEPCGASLDKISTVNTKHLDPRVVESEFILAHDVNNALVGSKGALMYAPQKGATSMQLETLKLGFEHFATCLQKHIQDPHIGILPGTGAAGGLAAGLFVFLKAKLIPGAEALIDILNLSETIRGADLVITGEGQIDAQTLYGKAPIAIAQLAQSQNIPAIAIVGNIGKDYEAIHASGIQAVFSITDGPRTEDYCKENVSALLTQASMNIARFMQVFKLDKG